MGAQNTIVWQIGCKYGFVTETIKAQLIAITNAQWKLTMDSGGKTVVSGTIGGESVSFQLPQGFNPAGLAELCRATYREITDMTDAEVETYALREDIDGIRPNFSTLEV